MLISRHRFTSSRCRSSSSRRRRRNRPRQEMGHLERPRREPEAGRIRKSLCGDFKRISGTRKLQYRERAVEITRDNLFPAYSQPVKRIIAPALALLTGLLCICLPSYANTKQVFEETYKLPAGGQFLLDNVNGSVQVEGWDRDE